MLASEGTPATLVRDADGAKVSIPGDSILCSRSLKSNTAVVEELRGSASKFFAIGNFVSVECHHPHGVSGLSRRAGYLTVATGKGYTLIKISKNYV